MAGGWLCGVGMRVGNFLQRCSLMSVAVKMYVVAGACLFGMVI